MIHSMSFARTARGADATPPLPPLPATPAAAQGQGGAMRGFADRMTRAVSEAQETVVSGPDVAANALASGSLPPLPMAADGGRGAASAARVEGEEVEPGLSPEQWLLGMIDQQLAEIQARDAAGTGPAAALVAAEPDGQQPPQAPALCPADWLAGLPGEPAAGTAQAAASGSQPFNTSSGPGRLAEASAAALFVAAPAVAPAPAMPALPLAAEAAADVTPDNLLDALEASTSAEPPAGAAEAGRPTPGHAAERTLRLQAPDSKWGEQMLLALREHVDLQVQQKVQNATIRLDPPELGSLEILLSHESGRLHVQLSAGNADVARLLQQSSDRLRQELVGQHFVQVSVQVGADGGGGQGQPRQRMATAPEEAPLAARAVEPEPERGGTRPRDVLVTV